ncbi:MAG: S9 family peptidase, partial [Planctomycetota bacterium]
MHIHRLLTCPTLLLLATVTAARGADPVTTSDLLRLRSISSIDVASDGSKAVLAVRSIGTLPPAKDAPKDAEPVWRNQSHLFLLDLFRDDSTPVQLTFGDRNDHAPQISPDGTMVVFARAATEPEAKPQVWTMSLAGGEARQVTRFERGAAHPKWSPDGRRLVVSVKVPLHEIDGAPPWPMERPGRTWKDAEANDNLSPRPDGTRAEIRAWLAANAQAKDPVVINRLQFQDELKLHEETTFTHLYLVDPGVDAAAPVRLTSRFADHLEAEFMPDGQSVVYVAKMPEGTHPDRVLDTSIREVELDGGADRARVVLAGWSLRQPRPSRDGTVIAVLGRRMDEPSFRQTQLGLAPANGDEATEPVWLTDETTFDASVRSAEWLSSRAGLVMSAAWQGGFPLLSVSPGLLEPAPLVVEADELPVGVHAFGIGGGSIVYAMTSAANPCVVRVLDGRGDWQAWDPNEWVSRRELSVPREGVLTRPDGRIIQYWLMPPTSRDPDAAYPLALEIHGGPAGMWGPGEFTMWHEFQLLCSWGYGVVYANPRGS